MNKSVHNKGLRSTAGIQATLDEMSYPDWKQRLERAERESREGKAITLEDYIKKRKRRSRLR